MVRRWRSKFRVRQWLRALTLRTFAMYGIAIAASIALVVIAAELKHGALDRVDVRVEMAVHRLDSPICDAIMMSATVIGSSYVLFPVIGIVTLIAIYRRKRAAAILLLSAMLVVEILDAVMKVMFARERPDLFEKIALPSDYSFPSGHAMCAMGIYGVIAAVVAALYPTARRPIIAIAIVGIALIGFSRIYLGVHWPSDVLGGYLGGVPPLVVSVHLLHRRHAHDRTMSDLVPGGIG
jgi:membrane-associated phospholipid phosphatase